MPTLYRGTVQRMQAAAELVVQGRCVVSVPSWVQAALPGGIWRPLVEPVSRFRSRSVLWRASEESEHVHAVRERTRALSKERGWLASVNQADGCTRRLAVGERSAGQGPGDRALSAHAAAGLVRRFEARREGRRPLACQRGALVIVPVRTKSSNCQIRRRRSHSVCQNLSPGRSAGQGVQSQHGDPAAWWRPRGRPARREDQAPPVLRAAQGRFAPMTGQMTPGQLIPTPNQPTAGKRECPRAVPMDDPWHCVRSGRSG
jgi:hypothetical protein